MQNPFNLAAQSINETMEWCLDNIRLIFIAVVAIYFVKNNVLPRLSEKSYRLTSGQSQTRGASNYKDEMRKTRERQQQVAELKAKAAAIERKKKEESERLRKNDLDSKPAKALKNRTSTAAANGENNPRAAGYNPMQPWSSGSGSSYRPARRSTNRG